MSKAKLLELAEGLEVAKSKKPKQYALVSENDGADPNTGTLVP